MSTGNGVCRPMEIQALRSFHSNRKKNGRLNFPKTSLSARRSGLRMGKRSLFWPTFPEGTQVWTADVASGKVKVLSKAYVMVTLTGRRGYGRGSAGSQMLQWTPSGSIITLLVPDDRGPEPKESAVPSSPLIRHTRKKATPTPTYPFLLRTAHDKALFRYYTTAQLAELTPESLPARSVNRPCSKASHSVRTENISWLKKWSNLFIYRELQQFSS